MNSIDLPPGAAWAVFVPAGQPSPLGDLIWLSELVLRMPGRIMQAQAIGGRLYAGTEQTPAKHAFLALAEGRLAEWRAQEGKQLEKRYPRVVAPIKGLIV